MVGDEVAQKNARLALEGQEIWIKSDVVDTDSLYERVENKSYDTRTGKPIKRRPFYGGTPVVVSTFPITENGETVDNPEDIQTFFEPTPQQLSILRYLHDTGAPVSLDVLREKFPKMNISIEMDLFISLDIVDVVDGQASLTGGLSTEYPFKPFASTVSKMRPMAIVDRVPISEIKDWLIIKAEQFMPGQGEVLIPKEETIREDTLESVLSNRMAQAISTHVPSEWVEETFIEGQDFKKTPLTKARKLKNSNAALMSLYIEKTGIDYTDLSNMVEPLLLDDITDDFELLLLEDCERRGLGAEDLESALDELETYASFNNEHITNVTTGEVEHSVSKNAAAREVMKDNKKESAKVLLELTRTLYRDQQLAMVDPVVFRAGFNRYRGFLKPIMNCVVCDSPLLPSGDCPDHGRVVACDNASCDNYKQVMNSSSCSCGSSGGFVCKHALMMLCAQAQRRNKLQEVPVTTTVDINQTLEPRKLSGGMSI